MPPDIRSSRSANCPASVRSCSALTTVRPQSRRSSSTISRASTRWDRSSALVGSSMSSTGASCASARASTTRWRSPPESVERWRRRQEAEIEPLEQATAVRDVVRRLHGEIGDVRRPPQQDVVEDRHVGRQLRRLRHVRHRPRPVAPGHRSRRPSAQAHLAVVIDQSRHRAQQRRLPCTVRADQADPLAPPDRRVHPVDHRTPVVAHRHGVELDHRRNAVTADRVRRAVPSIGQPDDGPEPRHQDPVPMPALARRDTSTARKNGAPRHAVTTPIGTSVGDRIVRAMRSAPIRKAAPPTIETGMMMR